MPDQVGHGDGVHRGALELIVATDDAPHRIDLLVGTDEHRLPEPLIVGALGEDHLHALIGDESGVGIGVQVACESLRGVRHRTQCAGELQTRFHNRIRPSGACQRGGQPLSRPLGKAPTA